MAVAMEVAWRGAELSNKSVVAPVVLDLGKKRAWGADTEKLMQLMMGQFGTKTTTSSSPVTEEVTLNLLGSSSTAAPSSSCRGVPELDCNSSPEFLELDPDQPLPSGWEKCLDLKTGEIYFVNKSTDVRTSEDPRKQLQAEVAPHEFLASKRSETLREESLRASTSSGTSSGGGTHSSSPRDAPQRLSFSTGKQLWSLQLDDRSTVSLNNGSPLPQLNNSQESNLVELDLNLSAGGVGSPSRHQSVCTMEMVEQALKRTEKAMGKREMLGSSSFSSLTSSRSEPSWSHSSPSTSSSSSTSSRSAHLTDSQALRVCEAESQKDDALVMGACTRCLTYVMLHKSDPKCPRCESEVPLDSFIAPPSKRQRVET